MNNGKNNHDNYDEDEDDDEEEEGDEDEDDDDIDESEEDYDYAIELYRAIENDDKLSLTELLDNGADAGLKPFEDKSRALLHICCEKGRTECATILLDHGADILVKDEWGMTSLMYSVRRQDIEMVKILLSRDSEIIHCRNIAGKSALHSAVETGQPEIVNLLLGNNANVNTFTDIGITPLMTLCMDTSIENKVTIAQILIDAGADLSMRDYKCKRTALQKAVISGNFVLLETLLSAGSNPNLLDVTGRSPLTNLIERHARITDRQPEVRDDVMVAALQLIKAGTDLDNCTCEYSNPLVTSASVKATSLMKVILEYGADPDVTFRSGVTALLVSVMKRNVPAVRTLLEWNCRLDMKGRVALSKYEESYLDSMELAIERGFWDVVELLISAGYNLSKLNYLRGGHSISTVPKSLSQNINMLNFLQYRASNPLLLFHLSVLVVLKALHRNLRSKINELPLPPTIKNMMKEYDFSGLLYENGVAQYIFGND